MSPYHAGGALQMEEGALSVADTRWQDTYILEAGLNNDVELPYTCRGGICG